jgi:hypothetical protein
MALFKKIVVVLGLPRPVATTIIRVTNILAAMVANKTTFVSPPIALVTVQGHVAALVSAEADTKTKAKDTYPIRDAALKLVVEDARQLHGYVQQLANANPVNAESIASEAAMTLRKPMVRPVHDLTVKQAVSGAIHVAAGNVVKGTRAHEWETSLDGGKSWTAAPPTTKASTVISGITPGTFVQVRHRSIVKGASSDWSSPATFLVA